jgi:hypothetical protein
MFYFITFATSHDRYSYINKANFNDFSLHYSALTTKQKYTLPHIELSPPPQFYKVYINYVSLYFFFLLLYFFCLIEKQQIARKIIQS